MISLCATVSHDVITWLQMSKCRWLIQQVSQRVGTGVLLPPAMKLQQCNVFTPVCDSVHTGVSVGEGGSLSRRGFGPGGLCPGEPLSRRGSLWGEGGLCPGGGFGPGGLGPREPLSRGVSA